MTDTAAAINATNLGCSITCKDLEASIRFYRDAIGFAVAQTFENEGKVVAAVVADTFRAGPSIVTDAGSETIRLTTNPGAGLPSIGGTTSTVFDPDNSSVADTDPGLTCVTSTPGGVDTWSVRSTNVCSPGRMPVRSTRASKSRGSEPRNWLSRPRT